MSVTDLHIDCHIVVCPLWASNQSCREQGSCSTAVITSTFETAVPQTKSHHSGNKRNKSALMTLNQTLWRKLKGLSDCVEALWVCKIQNVNFQSQNHVYLLQLLHILLFFLRNNECDKSLKCWQRSSTTSWYEVYAKAKMISTGPFWPTDTGVWFVPSSFIQTEKAAE